MSCRVALIINTYDQPEYLQRVLRAVGAQTEPPAEVLLADDGSGEDTRRLFAAWSQPQPFPTRHVWQEHGGFRRSRILNRAIAGAAAPFLVFLDGDTLPHPQFVADHRQLARPGWFTQGHRALIGRRAARWFGTGEFAADRLRACWSGQISGLKHAFRWPRAWVQERADLRGIRGCNLGIWRADLETVNGYNEAFEGWGREDSELAVRLMNSGVRRADVRGRALCYHLWHPPAGRNNLAHNDALLAAAQREGRQRCEHGLASPSPPDRASPAKPSGKP